MRYPASLTKMMTLYLMFEDLKPAGFEAVAIQSGQTLRARRVDGSDERPVYAELRDRIKALESERIRLT